MKAGDDISDYSVSPFEVENQNGDKDGNGEKDGDSDGDDLGVDMGKHVKRLKWRRNVR